MEQTVKNSYEAPITLVVEVTTEGCILQASQEQYNPVNW